MDYYDRFESDLNDHHDYNICMAACPDGKDCGCSGTDDPRGWLALGLTVLLIVIICVVIHIIETRKENKALKEWEEKYKIDKNKRNK